MWLHVGRKRAERFSVLRDFWTELLITVTMADAAPAPLSGKLPIHPRIRDSDPASSNGPEHFGRGRKGLLCAKVCVRLPGGRTPTSKSFRIGRSGVFLLFRNWCIRARTLPGLTFGSPRFQGGFRMIDPNNKAPRL